MKDNTLEGKTILYNSNSKANGTETLRTVTAGKTYYMIMAGLSYKATASSRVGILYVDSDTNHLIHHISAITATYNEVDRGSTVVVFPHPLPVAAGIDININSDAATIGVYGWIVGWEE